VSCPANNDSRFASPGSRAKRRVATAFLLLTLAGCSWFGRKPAPAPAVAPAETFSAEPVSAARAACANYDTLVRDAPFPRDAIIRGIDSGKASVVFAVDGTRITILSVTSSAPAFGDAAADAARALHCAVDRPARFSVAFEWRTVR
jgi:hypothetical protein